MYIVSNLVSPLIRRSIVKEASPILRQISFLKRIRPQSVLLDKSKHEVIYEFPYISHTSYLIRTKLWLPAFATFITPVGVLFQEIRFTVLGVFLASWLHSAIVAVASRYTINTIGKVYVPKENEGSDIIISAIDLNGNRIDRCHKPHHLVSCEYSTRFSRSAGFIAIYAEDVDIVYQLNVNTCKIHNPEMFISLFGSQHYFPEKSKSLK